MTDSGVVEPYLAHYGIKGMRWGVRRARGAAVLEKHAQKSGKVTKKKSVHPDSQVARSLENKMKIRGMDSLSNKEMQHLINRMNLERQMSSLQSAHENPAKQMMKSIGKDQARKRINKGVDVAVAGAGAIAINKIMAKKAARV